MQFWVKAYALALLAPQAALAYPTPPEVNVTEELFNFSAYRLQTANLPDLRVLPLGASITYGTGSTHRNGYRQHLWDAMRFAGHEVDMVGSRRIPGTMNDDDNEGWPGHTVSRVNDEVRTQYEVKPNLVLINAGTNDCIQNEQEAVVNAAGTMEKMVRDIFDNIPEVTIVLSGLLPNRARAACTRHLNEQYARIVGMLADAGEKIVFGDTHDQDGFLSVDDLLAGIFWAAVAEANRRELITPPLANNLPGGGAHCDKRPGQYSERVQSQRGSGGDDGLYEHKGVSQGLLWRLPRETGSGDRFDRTYWADLNADGKDELLYYEAPEGLPGYFTVLHFPEEGDPVFGGTINVHDRCKPRGVRWGDVNADGRDDFICIGPEGNMYVSINRGNPNPLSPQVFEYVGTYMTNPQPGRSQTHVRLGDIDGDGRLDYCLIADNGDISCWRNGWINDTPEYWQPLGVVFTGKNMGNIDGVRLVDINGDHRADWLYVHGDGSVETWTSSRGYDKSLRPFWRDSGRTHAGMGEVGARERVLFGRMTHSGRADYLVQQWVEDDARIHLHWWRNDGSGGTQLKADGDFYCDMTGDKMDDYIWVSDTGNYQIFRNIGQLPDWGQEGWVFTQEWDRKRVRIADVDGDGKCDIIYLAENGVVEHWYKTHYENGQWRFEEEFGEIRDLHPCSQRDGVGLFDLAVRFADLNGDGKADRLCIDPDGRTFADLSSPTAYFNMGQVKKPEGKDRANLRFVDVNGDGKADMVWLDKFGGESEVWYNQEQTPAPGTGSSMTWRPGGKAYRQAGRGEATYFAHQNGDGRSDMLDINPYLNVGYTFMSNPCGGGGGDDGLVHDPRLPYPHVRRRPEFFPNFPVFWAMGNSYPAGIGAGAHYRDNGPGQYDLDPGDSCRRNVGAYSHQIWQSDPHLRPNRFAFMSCTSARTWDLLTIGQFADRPAQLQLLRERISPNAYAWGTLSVGGNDAGFGDIAKMCLVAGTEGACNTAMENAWRKVRGGGTEAQEYTAALERIYTEILNTATTRWFTLVVTGYAQFFNAETDECDNETLSIVELGPKLDKNKRRRLNELVIAVNIKIASVVNAVNYRYSDKSVRFMDIDPLFKHRRFCDVDERGNARHWKDDAWFLTIAGSDVSLTVVQNGTASRTDPSSESVVKPVDDYCPDGVDEQSELGQACARARQLQQEDPDSEVVVEPLFLDWARKFCHPTTAGHTVGAP
ncbi:SGNH hydrolase-type esterase domain-containing protein [Aspergillus keveii]|uniref:SGNH hydrolase-type esterase domain-containing protein n=1 Tax=Aspergillus keveii TaxID=714993 RepID=A0ABR4FPW7_9EURO